MNRKVIILIHLSAATIAFLTILSLFVSSLTADLLGDKQVLRQVKTIIVYCLPILFIVMPTLGITGNKLAGKSTNPIVQRKLKRMKFIMLNGLLLTFLAIFLYRMAISGEFTQLFYSIQLMELTAGATNLTLLGLMFKDGFTLSGRIRKKSAGQLLQKKTTLGTKVWFL